MKEGYDCKSHSGGRRFDPALLHQKFEGLGIRPAPFSFEQNKRLSRIFLPVISGYRRAPFPPAFTLRSLGHGSQTKELQSNTKKTEDRLFQLLDGRLFRPQVVNIIVKLFTHRHLVRSGVDVSEMVLSCAPQLIQDIIPGFL